MGDYYKLFSFRLISERKITYAGMTERDAFNRARVYHMSTIVWEFGETASPCQCAGSKVAEETREGGWLICKSCAGYFG